jgi:DNA-binding NtrC family response regulator
VVDDEELIRQTIRDVLGQYGCTVEIAGDGASAKEMIACCRYDLVISDIRMPGASGYEVFAAAKAACCDTKVILITGFGYDPHHSIVRANKEGLSSVLMKPFKVKQLLDECRNAFTPKN